MQLVHPFVLIIANLYKLPMKTPYYKPDYGVKLFWRNKNDLEIGLHNILISLPIHNCGTTGALNIMFGTNMTESEHVNPRIQDRF